MQYCDKNTYMLLYVRRCVDTPPEPDSDTLWYLLICLCDFSWNLTAKSQFNLLRVNCRIAWYISHLTNLTIRDLEVKLKTSAIEITALYRLCTLWMSLEWVLSTNMSLNPSNRTLPLFFSSNIHMYRISQSYYRNLQAYFLQKIPLSDYNVQSLTINTF